MKWMAVLLAAAVAPAQQSKFPLLKLHVEGLKSLAAEAVAKASGLREGSMVEVADFDSGCRRLVDTGWISFCNYAYKPVQSGGKDGYDLTFQLQEASATDSVRLSFPGADTAQIWSCLKQNDPLCAEKIPGPAVRYCAEAIGRCLPAKSSVVWRTRVEDTGSTVHLFRPDKAPLVGDVRFAGNEKFTADQLAEASFAALKGEEFAEDELERRVDLTLRPLYERQGHWKVGFAVKAAGPEKDGRVPVLVEVREGKAYTLAAVEIGGSTNKRLEELAGLEIGRLANANAVRQVTERMTTVLQDEGYLAANAKPDPVFDDAAGTVRLRITVEQGPRYLFGKLVIEGVDAGADARLRRLWKLRSGEPMKPSLVREFVNGVMKELGGRTMNTQMEPRAGTELVDFAVRVQ